MTDPSVPDRSTEERTSSSVSTAARPDGAFVLGLDGVPWNLIQQWTDDGELPAFTKILENGAAGPLESTVPDSTPLAWPSIATGTWPDKHGIYWFQKLMEDGTHRMNTSEDLQQPALWEFLSPAVVGNVPMTYPAPEIDGTLVSGMMSPGVTEDCASPKAFAQTLTDRIPEYRIGLDWQEYADRPAEFESDLSELLSTRRKLMELLMETDDWRLFFFVYTAPDRLQHLLWDEETLLRHYRELDDILGEVMEYVDQHDSVLYIVSDHGFGPIDQSISLPRVLEQAGHLQRQETSGSRGHLSRLGLTKSTVESWLDTVGLDNRTVVDYLPQAFVNAVALHIPGTHSLYDIDYEQTEAFVHGSGCVYINDTERFKHGSVAPDHVESVKQAVKESFERLVDPETNEQVLDVYDGDELFGRDDRSPDLVVKGIAGYEGLARLTDDVFIETEAKAASHRPEGIFFAWGPGIEAGSTPSEASVVDVAPTLLHSIGEPIPSNMDGRVLDSIFSETTPPVERSGTADDSDPRRLDRSEDDHDTQRVEDRLRGLGYLD